MDKKVKRKLNCKEATILIVQKEEAGISLSARFSLFLHLLICTYCSRFFKQSKQISTFSSNLDSALHKHPHFKLEADQKKQLQEQINSLNTGSKD